MGKEGSRKTLRPFPHSGGSRRLYCRVCLSVCLSVCPVSMFRSQRQNTCLPEETNTLFEWTNFLGVCIFIPLLSLLPQRPTRRFQTDHQKPRISKSHLNLPVSQSQSCHVAKHTDRRHQQLFTSSLYRSFQFCPKLTAKDETEKSKSQNRDPPFRHYGPATKTGRQMSYLQSAKSTNTFHSCTEPMEGLPTHRWTTQRCLHLQRRTLRLQHSCTAIQK